MDMAKTKLIQLSEHGSLLDRYGACIRVLGQKELLNPDVQEAIDRTVEMTKKNNKAVLNICFPYTSREEITTAIRSTVEEWSRPIERTLSEKGHKSPFKEDRIANTIRSQQLSDHTKTQTAQFNSSGTAAAKEQHEATYLQPPGPHSAASSTTSLSSALSTSPSDAATQDTSQEADTSLSSISSSHSTTPPSPRNKPPTQPTYPSPELITPATLTAHMFTATDPPLDLLIRTSGVERLSDFMLWQCHQHTQIVFVPVLWPDFDLWSFLPVIWEWQWRVMKRAKREREERGRDGKLRVSRSRSRGGQAEPEDEEDRFLFRVMG